MEIQNNGLIEFRPNLANEICWGCNQNLDHYGYCRKCDGY